MLTASVSSIFPLLSGILAIPQLHHRIRAPRTPCFTAQARARRARLGHCTQYAEIVVREGIRPSERAHGDVPGCPWTDAANRFERLPCALDVGSGCQHDVAASDRARELDQRTRT